MTVRVDKLSIWNSGQFALDNPDDENDLFVLSTVYSDGREMVYSVNMTTDPPNLADDLIIIIGRSEFIRRFRLWKSLGLIVCNVPQDRI